MTQTVDFIPSNSIGLTAPVLVILTGGYRKDHGCEVRQGDMLHQYSSGEDRLCSCGEYKRLRI